MDVNTIFGRDSSGTTDEAVLVVLNEPALVNGKISSFEVMLGLV
jgi:hypothetical protein